MNLTFTRTIAAACAFAALSIGAAAVAQTPPVDPLDPGAALQEAQSDSASPSAAAKPAAAKPARRRPKGAAGLSVVVSNKRSVGLVELKVGPAGEPDPKKVAGPLAFGRKTIAHLKPAKDCLYDVRGHFADEADTEQLGVDLCKDKAINLTDD